MVKNLQNYPLRFTSEEERNNGIEYTPWRAIEITHEVMNNFSISEEVVELLPNQQVGGQGENYGRTQTNRRTNTTRSGRNYDVMRKSFPTINEGTKPYQNSYGYPTIMIYPPPIDTPLVIQLNHFCTYCGRSFHDIACKTKQLYIAAKEYFSELFLIE